MLRPTGAGAGVPLFHWEGGDGKGALVLSKGVKQYPYFIWREVVVPGVCSFCWNCTERQILWSLCSVDFHTLTLQLPIQTPHSVAPELPSFCEFTQIFSKTSTPPWILRASDSIRVWDWDKYTVCEKNTADICLSSITWSASVSVSVQFSTGPEEFSVQQNDGM